MGENISTGCCVSEVYTGGGSHARSSGAIEPRVACVCRGGQTGARAQARLIHSLLHLARLCLVDVGLGRKCRRLDGKLHDLGGIGDLGAANQLGVLPTAGLDCEQCVRGRCGANMAYIAVVSFDARLEDDLQGLRCGRVPRNRQQTRRRDWGRVSWIGRRRRVQGQAPLAPP